MSNVSQGPKTAKARLLGTHIDVYECLSCSSECIVTADHLTFSQPPPMECDSCDTDMVARRFVEVSRIVRASEPRRKQASP